MIRPLICLWLSIAIATTPSMAFGQADSGTEADRLQSLIANDLGGAFHGSVGRVIRTDPSAVDIVPTPQGYAVTIPGMSIVLEGRRTLEIPSVTAMLTPRPGRQVFDATFAIPERFGLLGNNVPGSRSLYAEEVSGSAVLSLTHNAVLEATFAAGELRAEHGFPGETRWREIARLAEWRMHYTLKPRADGRFDQLRHIEVREYQQPARNDDPMTAAAIRLSIGQGTWGIDREGMEALRHDIEDQLAISTSAPSSEDDRWAIMSTFSETIEPLFDGGFLAIRAQGFAISGDTVSATGQGVDLQVAVDGLRRSRADVDLRLTSTQAATVEPESLQPGLPVSILARASWVDLPSQALYGPILGTLIHLPGGLGRRTPSLWADLNGLVEALSDSTVLIHQAHIHSGGFSFALQGQVDRNRDTALGLTARANAQMRGSAGLIDRIRGLPNGPTPAAILTVIRMLGQSHADGSGESVRRYVLEIETDGAVRLNGTDVMPLIHDFQNRRQ